MFQPGEYGFSCCHIMADLINTCIQCLSDTTGNKMTFSALKYLEGFLPCFSRFEISSQMCSLSMMVQFKYKLYLNNVPNLLEDLLEIMMLEIKMRAPF